jgi:hypothetical protein
MNTLSKVTFAGLIAASALAITATSASARIVCNGEGDCWHVRDNFAYRPEFGLVVHPDNWKWGAGDHFRWREHEGRGYWKGGAWVGF